MKPSNQPSRYLIEFIPIITTHSYTSLVNQHRGPLLSPLQNPVVNPQLSHQVNLVRCLVPNQLSSLQGTYILSLSPIIHVITLLFC
jgi:hypothetical protein